MGLTRPDKTADSPRFTRADLDAIVSDELLGVTQADPNEIVPGVDLTLDLGLDSLDRTELAICLEEACGLREAITTSDAAGWVTVASVGDYLFRRVGRAD